MDFVPIVISGSRDWPYNSTVEEVDVKGSKGYRIVEGIIYPVLMSLPENALVIHGGSSGVDNTIQKTCEQIGIQTMIVPANWTKNGKPGGPIRNNLMLDFFKPEEVIAFLYNDSKGTTQMINSAKNRGIPVSVYEWQKVEELILK